jgi:glutamate-ammonia-ligase adenylyltransferase
LHQSMARRWGAERFQLRWGLWPAGQLNAGSDLDLILIYDADPDAMSDGPRPLQTRTYFARLTQALITALTAQLPEGRLYEVDMRLRPSGRQGPVASGWASYASYQKEEAWTWEHLALTRAQALGDGALAEDWNALRDDILRDTQKDVLGDTSDMRARLAGRNRRVIRGTSRTVRAACKILSFSPKPVR